MTSRRLLPWIIPAAIGAAYLAAFRWVPQAILWYGIASIIAFIGLTLVIRDRVRTPAFWLLVTPPATYLVTATTFLLFLEQQGLRLVLLAVTLCFFGIYMHAVYLLGYEPSRYQPFSLEAISSYLHLISIFCAGVVGYGLLVFLTVPLWLLSLLMALLLTITISQSLWVHKVDVGRRAVYTAVLVIVLVELFWVLAYVPIHFYVHGALLALAYYELWGIARAHALHLFNRSLVIRYTIVGLVLAAALILTTSWS